MRRSGRALVVLQLALLAASAAAQDPGPDLSPWRTEDLLDPRIDVDAQYSLMRLFAGTVEEAITASNILSALRSGDLAGVYQVDRRVPAERARSQGKGWWEVIPEGRSALCWRESPILGEDAAVGDRSRAPPMIVYRQGLAGSRRLDALLVSAALSCPLPLAPPKVYVETIHRPPPKVEAPGRETSDEVGHGAIFARAWSKGGPLAGATVTVTPLGSDETLSEVTGSSGEAAFSVRAGRFDVSASNGGSITFATVRVPPDGEVSVELDVGDDRSAYREACSLRERAAYDVCMAKATGERVTCSQEAGAMFAGCDDSEVGLVCRTVAVTKQAACERDFKKKYHDCVRAYALRREACKLD